ncbi:MAG: DUF4058 family protein [Planctomycetes bacterium]|nr:DUF4058 family protein [Planctomycetota bacterium]
MPSPFPGMDPYLEDARIWEDFHASLAAEIRDQLAPSLRPRYVAALAVRVTYDEVVVRWRQSHSIKPDGSVLRAEDRPSGGVAIAPAIAPAPLVGMVAPQIALRLYGVEVRRVEDDLLVTAIEILSPVNKRPGHEAFESYHRKRGGLLRSAAHLMEIDLLRAGRRWALLTPLPAAPYFTFLSRADKRPQVEIWPLRFQEPIPVLPVPLLEPDPDVPLDLGRAIRAIYDRAGYDLRIDYRQPVPSPELVSEDAEWVATLLQAGRTQE